MVGTDPAGPFFTSGFEKCQGVTCVINYDAAGSGKDYVHRHMEQEIWKGNGFLQISSGLVLVSSLPAEKSLVLALQVLEELAALVRRA